LANSLIPHPEILSKLKLHYPILWLLLVFNLIIILQFNSSPNRPDELWYIQNVAAPELHLKLIFRYFHFFTAKLFSFLFHSPIDTAKAMSVIYANLIVIVAFLIGKLVSPNGGMYAAMFAMLSPTLMYQSTWFGTDLSMTTFGLLSVYFCLKYIKYEQNWHLICSGFFLIAAIFSKQTGIIFLAPFSLLAFIIYTSNKQRLLRVLPPFFAGFGLCFLYLSMCSLVFVGDFFYFINPQTYIDFLDRFGDQLSNDSEVKVKKTPTYYSALLSSSPVSILYFVGSSFWVVLLFLPNIWRNEHTSVTRYAVIFMITLFLCVLFLHEVFHTFYYGLKLHPRYVMPSQVCIAIAFGILLSLLRDNFKLENRDASELSPITILGYITITAIFLLILTNATGASDLRQIRWIAELFTLWASCLFVALMSYFAFTQVRDSEFRWKLFKAGLFYTFFIVLADGIVNSKYMYDRKIYRYPVFENAISNLEKCKSFSVTAYIETREQVNLFEYITGKGLLPPSTFTLFEKATQLEIEETKIGEVDGGLTACKIVTDLTPYEHTASDGSVWQIKNLGYSVFLVSLGVSYE
jgi:4-amino-4-deoxy-L-arabinose transferase-like glycosyltransferase